MNTSANLRFKKLQKLYRRYYFHNQDGLITGRNLFDLIYAVESEMIFCEMGVDSSKGGHFVLKQAISMGLSFNLFKQTICSKNLKAS
ncbi:MAG: hypothetical protein AB7F86_08185 [Bdellovibrionales bacterium]